MKRAALVAMLLLAGCTSISPAGRRVRFVDQVRSDCEFIAAIEGNQWVNGGENQLRNEAAKLGANWVVVTATKWEGYARGHRPGAGDAYRCPEGINAVISGGNGVNINVNQFR